MIKSLKLKQLLVNLEQLKYANNTFNSKIHEESVEKIIRECGFKHKLCINKKEKSYYMNQPNGTQNPPDFIVFDNNESIQLECKSKKTGYKPMWNSSIPNESTFYIFTNQKDNKTLIISGKNIITPALKECLNIYKKETKKLEILFNKKLKKLSTNNNPYNIGVYARNMFVQNKHLTLFKKKCTKTGK